MFAKFSETSGLFVFSEDDNGGVKITAEAHVELVAWQAAGKTISVGALGAPMMSEPRGGSVVFARFAEADGRFAFSDQDNGGVRITVEAHDALMAGQASGKSITAGADGRPVLVVPTLPVPTGASVRANRSALLAVTDWSQLADVAAATRESYRAYRQALRDVTKQPGFPEHVDWPVLPT